MDDAPAGGVPSDTFTRHRDSVLCCSIDNRAKLAVSGGIDDTAYVWNLETRHVIFECSGHKESVVAAAFSVNSTYVATGDLNGYIQVRNTTTGIKISEYDVDEINWLLWHNSSEFVLIAGTTKGDFWMWNVNDPAAVKTFPSFGPATTAAKLLPDGVKIVIAYGDGSARLFDLKTRQSVSQYSDASGSEVISLSVCPSKALLAIGCIDSSIKLITLPNLKLVGTLFCKSPELPAMMTDSTSATMADALDQSEVNMGDLTEIEKLDTPEALDQGLDPEPLEVIDDYNSTAHEIDRNENLANEDDLSDIDSDDDGMEDETAGLESVECVMFSECGKFILAANNSGTIRIWDLSTQVIRCECHTGIGVTRCSWTDDGRIVTACLDGYVRIYDTNLLLQQELQLHNDQILDMAVVGSILVSASEDKTCKVVGI